MKLKIFILSLFAFLGVNASVAFSHCQVPCGVYDDHARIAMMHEHVTTIEKAISQLNDLQSSGEKNYNQIVRWINTKDEHASEIQEIVTTYFMTQRIKPKDSYSDEYSKYLKEITLLHKILIQAMKAKQNVDSQYTKNLHDLIEMFDQSYFEEEYRAQQTNQSGSNSNQRATTKEQAVINILDGLLGN